MAIIPASYAQYNGNGVIDPGEECDDGNFASGDGCDATGHFEGGILIRKVHSGTQTPSFEFAASYSSSHFFLTRGAVNFSGYLSSSTQYTVQEVALPGWQLSAIDCQCFQLDTPGNDVTLPCKSTTVADLSSAQATINLVGAELVKCNFSNVEVGCSGATCAVCGNGALDPGEDCDNGAANSDTVFGPGACTTKCKFAVSDCIQKARDLAQGCNQSSNSPSMWILLVLLGILGYFSGISRVRVACAKERS